MEPLVSIVMPAYNAARFIAEAIESVFDQTHTNWELIVVDDGSTDGTTNAAQPYLKKIRYVRQDNAGSGAARNHGVSLGAGEYLAFLDADDRFRPGKVQTQLSALIAEPELDLTFGRVTEFVASDGAPTTGPQLRRPAVDREARLPGTMLVRSAAFYRVGPWSEDTRVEALDWFARADDAGLRATTIPVTVLDRRLHEHNKTLEPGMGAEYLHAIKVALDRRRRASDD